MMQNKRSTKKAPPTAGEVARILNRFTMEKFLATIWSVSGRRQYTLAKAFEDAARARAARRLSESEKRYCELEGIDPREFAARKAGA